MDLQLDPLQAPTPFVKSGGVVPLPPFAHALKQSVRSMPVFVVQSSRHVSARLHVLVFMHVSTSVQHAFARQVLQAGAPLSVLNWFVASPLCVALHFGAAPSKASARASVSEPSELAASPAASPFAVPASVRSKR